MRILITGERGFTARYVMPLLAADGHEVLPFEADITIAEEVQKRVSVLEPDAVLHLAGLSYVPHGCDGRAYAVNTVGTINLLDALSRLAAPPGRVVLASSAHVYGMQAGKIREASQLAPVTHYGASKLAMEHLARRYTSRFEIVITRPFNYTGVGQAEHFLVPKLVYAFRNRQSELRLGNLEVARDFSDVRYIARAYTQLLTKAHVPSLINLCSGQAVPIKSIIAQLEVETGFRPQISIDPALVRAQDIPYQWGDTLELEMLMGTAAPALEDTLSWMLGEASEGCL